MSLRSSRKEDIYRCMKHERMLNPVGALYVSHILLRYTNLGIYPFTIENSYPKGIISYILVAYRGGVHVEGHVQNSLHKILYFVLFS